MKKLKIGSVEFSSRLFVGSAGYPNQQVMMQALEASGTELVTVAMRRISLSGSAVDTVSLLRGKYRLLPNTAGCFTARDAVLTAELARESLETNWIKLEVIGDHDMLYPDVTELLKGAETLVKSGFVVLAYCNDDPITCQKLEDIGCAAVMPLAAPIGSGLGLINPTMLEIIRGRCQGPLIVDAGLGSAADAAIAMELGFDGVLANTAIAKCRDPVSMAQAMGLAVQAGHLSFQSGRIPKRFHAEASSPMAGLIGS